MNKIRKPKRPKRKKKKTEKTIWKLGKNHVTKQLLEIEEQLEITEFLEKNDNGNTNNQVLAI